MRQIRILFLSAAFIFAVTAVLISTVAVSGQQGRSSDSAPADIVYGQPGQLVDAGGFRLNLYCMGSGSPAVVFRFRIRRQGGLVAEGAATDRKVDTRVQL